MTIDIERANQTRTYILNRIGAVLNGCTLVLGDQGMRLELTFKGSDKSFRIDPQLPEDLKNTIALVTEQPSTMKDAVKQIIKKLSSLEKSHAKS